jgi:hypothetical protein
VIAVLERFKTGCVNLYLMRQIIVQWLYGLVSLYSKDQNLTYVTRANDLRFRLGLSHKRLSNKIELLIVNKKGCVHRPNGHV